MSYKHSDVTLVSLDCGKAVKACVRLGGFSLVWTMTAAASVLSRNIVSVYPPVNVLSDRAFTILPRTFSPLNNATHGQRPAVHMWTAALNLGPATWTPNHFFPLLVRNKLALECVIIDDDDVVKMFLGKPV